MAYASAISLAATSTQRSRSAFGLVVVFLLAGSFPTLAQVLGAIVAGGVLYVIAVVLQALTFPRDLRRTATEHIHLAAIHSGGSGQRGGHDYVFFSWSYSAQLTSVHQLALLPSRLASR